MSKLSLSRSAASKAVPLNAAKEAAYSEVKSTVHTLRQQFITDIAGQQMIYAEKENEATQFLNADPEPSSVAGWEADYPFIAGEVGTTGETAFEVAQIYMNLSAQWRVAGAFLEKLRIEANTAIEDATSEAGVEAAMQSFRDQVVA